MELDDDTVDDKVTKGITSAGFHQLWNWIMIPLMTEATSPCLLFRRGRTSCRQPTLLCLLKSSPRLPICRWWPASAGCNVQWNSCRRHAGHTDLQEMNNCITLTWFVK